MTLRSQKLFPMYLLEVVVACWLLHPASAQQTAAKEASPPAQSALSPSASDPQYVGSDTCKGCHEEQFNQIAQTQHWNTNLSGTSKKGESKEWHGCESCHGPGAEHVAGGGDKSKIFVFSGATAEASSARCLSCHSQSHTNFQRSEHYKANVGCTSCHSPHHAEAKVALLKTKQPLLCYGCHTDAKADFNRPFHHRVNEGLIQCQDCHNVHDSFAKAAKLSSTQDAICVKCHTEKRGPFVFEHLPVKTEGCSACHTPHGSNNQRLLNRSAVNNLCIECHGQSTFATLHNQSNKYTACTMCHVQIHGSNASNVFFK